MIKLNFLDPLTTTPLPPYGGESKAIWACVCFCLIPSVCFYGYVLFVLIKKLFRLARSTFQRHERLPDVEAESKSGNRKIRRWGSQVPESVKIGSEFFTGVWPQFQLILWQKGEDKIYRPVACGWRYANYLVTSSHCLPEGNILAISTAEGDICELEYSVAYNFDEVALVEIHQSFYDQFSVKSSKISGDVDTMVRVTGCDVKLSTSVGLLRPTDMFATYKYSGSTKPGFSGAPYIVGDTRVVAMHLCGGELGNLCVSATYIKTIVAKLTEERPEKVKARKQHYVKVGAPKFNVPEEELEKKKGKNKKKRKRANDWYTEDITADTKVRVRKSRYDPDEYEVELNGHYYTVDTDGLRDLRHRVKSCRGHITFDDRPDDSPSDTDRGDDGGSDDYGRSRRGKRRFNPGKVKTRFAEKRNIVDGYDSDGSDDVDFLEQRQQGSKNLDTATSGEPNLCLDPKVLMVLIRQCVQDSMILYESKKLNPSTLPSEGGEKKG